MLTSKLYQFGHLLSKPLLSVEYHLRFRSPILWQLAQTGMALR